MGPGIFNERKGGLPIYMRSILVNFGPASHSTEEMVADTFAPDRLLSHWKVCAYIKRESFARFMLEAGQAKDFVRVDPGTLSLKYYGAILTRGTSLWGGIHFNKRS
jgi:hypothetical protein